MVNGLTWRAADRSAYHHERIAAGQADTEAGRLFPINSLKLNCDASGWSGPTSSVGCVGVSGAFARGRRSCAPAEGAGDAG